VDKELEQGTPLGEAVRGRWRVLPRPLDIVITRAEASQALPQTFQAIARGSLHGLVAYEPPLEPLTTLRQGLFSMALMLIAGAPLVEALQRAGAPLASGTLEDGGLAVLMSRHPEVFPPSVIALIRRAEYAGDLARTLEFITREVIGRCERVLLAQTQPLCKDAPKRARFRRRTTMSYARLLTLGLPSVLLAACGGAERAENPKASTASCSGIDVPDEGPFDFKVALTFDDGPSVATTPQVIAILREEEVPAAFLVIGAQVTSEDSRDIIRDIAADPNFIIGSHSWSHPDMSKLSRTEVNQELDKNEHLLDSLGVEYSFFRFPFGASTCETMKTVKSRGYKPLGWHITSTDWCYAESSNGSCEALPDPYRSDMVGYVMSQVAQRKGGIILFHDIHQLTADSIGTVIRTLKEQGYTFVRIDDETVFPKLNLENP